MEYFHFLTREAYEILTMQKPEYQIGISDLIVSETGTEDGSFVNQDESIVFLQFKREVLPPVRFDPKILQWLEDDM